MELPEEIIANSNQLQEACDHLARVSVFGFDTEFIGENTYHPRLCLIQVATAEKLMIIDPLSLDSLDRFWELVVDPARVVIVHAGREEIRLCELGCGKLPGNLFDLQIAAGLVGLGYPLGHGPLIQQLLRVQLAKAETLTDWSRRPLTRQQLRYAYDDVRHMLPAWRRLTRTLERLERTSWAAEEFQALASKATIENPSVERWRKLRGLGALDRKRLAVARALYEWREEQAEIMNRPARGILRDDLLVEIARRLPQRDRELAVLRGLHRNEIGTIIDVVQSAAALPATKWPTLPERDNDPPQVTLVATLVMAVLNDLCARMTLTPGLVATSADVKHLVRSRFQGLDEVPADSCWAKGWRSRAILPPLQEFLDGRQSIRIGDIRAASPLMLATDLPPLPQTPEED